MTAHVAPSVVSPPGAQSGPTAPAPARAAAASVSPDPDVLFGNPAALPAADVVVAAPYFGWPPISGGWQRLLHTVRGLARAYRVVVVSQYRENRPPDDEARGFVHDSGCVGFVAVSARDARCNAVPEFGRWSPAPTLVRDLITHRTPMDARRHQSACFRRALVAARRSTGARTVWAFDPWNAEDVHGAGFETTILDVDDILSEIIVAELARLGRPRRLPLLLADLWRMRRWERALPRRFSRVVVAKEDDLRFFPAARRDRLAVLPNGVRIPPPLPPSPRESRTLLFVGSLDYEPNAVAVRHMIDEVLPRVWRERPDVLLQVVGRGNVRWLRERAAADPRISVAENVPDVAPYYRAAAAAVAPVQYGGGTRIKVLEALAFGRGLVSTTFAAEGCGLVDGTHVVYANDPAAFAAKCLALLAAPAERERLGAAGRAFVRAHYDWDVIEGRVAEIAAMTASRMAGSRMAGSRMTAGRG